MSGRPRPRPRELSAPLPARMRLNSARRALAPARLRLRRSGEPRPRDSPVGGRGSTGRTPLAVTPTDSRGDYVGDATLLVMLAPELVQRDTIDNSSAAKSGKSLVTLPVQHR